MCSIENAIDTMNKCVLVSHDVFKMLVDDYRNSHTEDAVTLMLDEQDIGVATEGEIIILLKSYRYNQEETEKLKKTNNELKEHIIALQGSANAFQVSKCESCRESARADKMLEKLNEMVDKYNELAHKYNELEANKPRYSIYAKDVLDAISSATSPNERKSHCSTCGRPIDSPEPCITYEDIINREG